MIMLNKAAKQFEYFAILCVNMTSLYVILFVFAL